MRKRTKETKKDRQSLRRVWQNDRFALKWLYKSSKFYVLFVIISNVISQIVAMIEHTFLAAYVVDCIQYGRSFADVVVVLLPLTLAITFNMAVYSYVSNCVHPKLIERINRDIRMKLYEKAAGMDIARYDDPTFYNDFVWAMRDAPDHMYGVLNTVSALCGLIALVLCMGTYMIATDAVGLIFVGVSLVFGIGMQTVVNKRRLRWREEERPLERRRDYINRVFYLADYAKDLRMGEMTEGLYADFEESSKQLEQTAKKHTRVMWKLFVIVQWITQKLLPDALYLGYLLFQTLVTGALGFGPMLALYNASNKLRVNLQELGQAFPQFQEHSLYIEKLRTFLDAENTLPDTGTAALPHGGTLTLDNVSFTYPGAENETLHSISMEIPKGAKIALVGYNGAGKSTLVKLLMRLYDPTAGTVCYDGQPLRRYPLDGYRAKIGTLFQEYQIMAATLCENVTMSADGSDGEGVRDCLHRVAFDEAMLCAGLDTPLTKEFEDNGVNLSGGEAQKVAIARVLYSDADVLILDEPSSALDPLAEYRLNQTIGELAADKTVIFISHRLSTTRMADCIYMLENGRIIERGSHDELMKQDGQYAAMFRLQAQKYR